MAAPAPATTTTETKAPAQAVVPTTTPFREKVLARAPGIVTFGMTPPRVTTTEEGMEKLCNVTADRLSSLPIDAAIIYDIHDEESRSPTTPRVFPYCDTHDGVKWMAPLVEKLPAHLSRVYYRCVVKHDKDGLTKFAAENKEDPRTNVVYVGGAAAKDVLPVTLPEALDMHKKVAGDDFHVGAVAIPERHESKGTEHTRMIEKQLGGARFFITQCVYSTELTKNMLSDYYYACKEKSIPMVPIIVTLAPVGSKKTYEFMQWLGVHTSKWLENDLNNSADEGRILEESVASLMNILRDLCQFCKPKGIPLGINVESIAIRKVEVEAATKLVADAKRILAEELGGAPMTSGTAVDAKMA